MSKEFEAWYEETYGETVESAEYGHDMGNYNGPPHPFAVRAAESRGIAKGRMEGLREALTEVTHGRAVTNFGHIPAVMRAFEWVTRDIEAAILSAAQPQEIAGKGCEWLFVVDCTDGTKEYQICKGRPHYERTVPKICPYCGKPIVMGGER